MDSDLLRDVTVVALVFVLAVAIVIGVNAAGELHGDPAGICWVTTDGDAWGPHDAGDLPVGATRVTCP